MTRRDHLKHYDDAHLTEPGVDTESHSITRDQAATMGPVALGFYTRQRRFLGRFLFGPAIDRVSLWTHVCLGMQHLAARLGAEAPQARP